VPLFVLGLASTASAQEAVPPQPPPVPVVALPEQAADASRWYANVDVLWLQRDYQPNFQLAETVKADASTMFRAVPIPGAPVLTLGDLANTTAQPGLRAFVGYRIAGTTAIELGYFGLQSWDRSGGIPAFDPPFANSPYLGSSIIYGNKSFDTSITARYSSEIHNAEVNLRHGFGNGPWNASGLVGFRYFNYCDQLTLTGLQTFPKLTTEPPPPPSQTFVEQTRATASNNLFGAQIGAELGRMWFNDRFGLSVNGKVGIFANNASQYITNGATLFTGGSGTTTLAAGRGGTDFASLYEGGITATVRLTSRITIRAGYQALFVQGLALAPTQLALTGTAIQQSSMLVPGGFKPMGQPVPPPSLPTPGTGSVLNTNGNILLHGPFVGLGVTY
jgi:hypothetical protein